MRRIATLAVIASLASVLSVTAIAEESAVRQPHALFDTAPQERPQELSFWLDLPWYYGFGIGFGVRYDIPIVKNGFIPKLNNAFSIEFGGDFAYAGLVYTGYQLLLFTGDVAARWAFYIFPKFAAYAKLGLGLGYEIYTGCGNLCASYSNGVAWYPDGAVGILYWVGERFALRAEAGSLGLRIGIGLDF